MTEERALRAYEFAAMWTTSQLRSEMSVSNQLSRPA